MKAGQLRSRVTIQQLAAGQDSIGQPVMTWGTYATMYADIRHQSGVEAIKGGAETSTVRASIRIRYKAGITAGMRVLHSDTAYQINAVMPSPKKDYTDLVCEVVT